MLDGLEIATNVAIAVEIAIAVVLVYRNRREVRYLEELEPEVEADIAVAGPLPLYHALSWRARYVTAVSVYLLVLTGLGAIGVVVADLFPPIRAINGALLLGILYEPEQVGAAIRKGRPDPEGTAESSAS